MKKPSSLAVGALVMGACFLVLKYLIAPPLPTSLLLLYLVLAGIAILAQVSVEEEGWREFIRPLRDLLVEERKSGLRRAVFIALPVLAALAVFAGLSRGARPPVEVRAAHPAPPTAMDFRGERIELRGLENPLRGDPEKFPAHLNEGKRVYYQNCHFCHGDYLDGKGMFAGAFIPRPSNFRDPGTIAQLQESYLFWRIAKGGPGLPDIGTPWNSAMPAWEHVLTRHEIWQVILFLYEATGQSPRRWE